MSFTSWLRNLRSTVAHGPVEGEHRRQRSLRASTYRPGFEVLEDRCLPSTFTVLNLLDTGALGDGSLRGEIAAAQSGDTIHFAPSLLGQTITLTGGELAITKSLDIEDRARTN